MLPAAGVTIGFSTTRKLASAIIRLVSGGRFFTADTPSHAWIAYDCDTLKTRMVLQAETHGYETIPWERWAKRNILIAEYRPVVDMQKHIPAMAARLGQNYDFSAAFYAGAKRWMGKWLRRVFRSPGKMMCAEAQQHFLSLEFRLTPLGLHPELSLPLEVMNVVSRRRHEYARLR